MSLMRNHKVIVRIAFLLAALIIVGTLLTGCVKGQASIGWSGIAVSQDNGTIYTGSKEGKLVSVKLADNSRQFSAGLKTSSGGVSIAIYGTPALATVSGQTGEWIYIGGYNGKVFAYDAGTLQERWEYPIDSFLKPIVSSITIAGNNLYFGDLDGYLYALDIATGQLIWKFQTGGEIWSTAAVDNGKVFISSFDKNIYAVDVNTGKEVWHYSTGATNVAPLVTFNNVVYVGSLDKYLYALNEADGSLKWKEKAVGWYWAKPILYSGKIFAPNLDGNVYAYNVDTGNLEATYDVGGQVASSPDIYNNQIIVATENGNLYSLDANSNSGSKRLISAIQQDITAPVKVIGDMVYISGSSDNNIYAFSITTGQSLSPISLKAP